MNNVRVSIVSGGRWLTDSGRRNRSPANSSATDGDVAAPDIRMDYLFPILLLTFLTWVSAFEPLAVMMQRRRNAYPIYASDFMEEYEPYAVAAIPIHGPVPILQVLSPSMYGGKFRKPTKRPQNNRDLHAFPSNIEQNFEPYTYNHIYEDHPKFPKRESYNAEASPVIVYARPNRNGGYTYRKPAPTPVPNSQKEKEPVIIRIHKYRIIH